MGATPTYNVGTFASQFEEQLWWGREGAAAGTIAATLFSEPYESATPTPNRTTWEDNSITGVPAGPIDRMAMTQHMQQVITLPWRSLGLGAYGLVSMLGDHNHAGTANDVPTAASPAGAAPATAPTAALVTTGTGAIDAGSHAYKYTYQVGGASTGASPASTAVINDATHNQNTITGFVAGPAGTTGLGLYRNTVGAPSIYKLVTTLAANATTYTDGAADAALTTTLTASPGYLHALKPGVLGNREPTFTIVRATGTGEYKIMTYATLQQIRLLFAPDTPLMVELTFLGNWTTFTSNAPGSATGVFTGVTIGATPPLTKTRAYERTFTIYGGSAGNTKYNCNMLGGDLTIMRNLEVIPASQGSGVQNPTDIIPGRLGMTATIDAMFTGIGATTAYPSQPFGDYIANNKTGTSTAKHSLKWTNSDLDSVEIIGWPAYWEPLNENLTGESIKLNGTLIFTQDPALAVSPTPAITVLDTVNLTNTLATSMVI